MAGRGGAVTGSHKGGNAYVGEKSALPDAGGARLWVRLSFSRCDRKSFPVGRDVPVCHTPQHTSIGWFENDMHAYRIKVPIHATRRRDPQGIHSDTLQYT